jgi:hypothetical protein
MRLNYTDDEDFTGQFALWQANCRRSLRGKAGQSALRRLEAALLAMPEKALIRGKLVNGRADVCAIGALALADGKLPAPEPSGTYGDDDVYDTAEWATKHLDVPKLVAWKIVAENDITNDTVWELAHGPVQQGHGVYRGPDHNENVRGIALIRPMTGEERYEKMLAWVRANIKQESVTP